MDIRLDWSLCSFKRICRERLQKDALIGIDATDPRFFSHLDCYNGCCLPIEKISGDGHCFYIASSFVSAVSYLNLLSDYSSILPQFMQHQIWAYTESEMGLNRLEGITSYGVAYADFLNALSGYFGIFLCILLLLDRGKLIKTKTREPSWLWCLLFRPLLTFCLEFLQWVDFVLW